MTLKDWTQSLLDKVKAGGVFGSQEGGMESNMANGGFSGYKPATARQHTMRQTQSQQPVAPENQPVDPMAGGMNWEQPAANQQPTGFTGMYNFTQNMGYQQPPVNNTVPFQQQAGAMPGMTGYQQPVAGAAWPEQQYGYMDNGMGAQGYGGMGGGAYAGGTMNYQPQGMPNQQTGRYQAPGASPQDNISYMPGSFVGDDGKAYSHVERVALVPNVSACYRIIEFMRNNESVIVNTEQITDEAENQRCLDLLYGAAFAMKCSFTRIAMKSIYLIAPTTVMVVPYDAIRRMSDQDMNTRWPDPDQDSRWEHAYRGGNGFTHSQQTYRSNGYRQDGDGYGRRSGYQEDYAGYGGYNAAGYGR